jgi:tRNA nucleotidyltransferase (CCA-adding enzyme)
MILTSELEKHFPVELVSLLRAAGDLAWSRGWNLYLVGGAVRDLFLIRPNLDLDLVLEGDAIALARNLAEIKGGEVVAHPRFGTAKFRQQRISLDLATARSESYPKPGALPVVTPGTIGEDLFRRDFSINAMAIHLDPIHFGALLDPYGGRGDLDRGLIRVLHEKSFSDDPTRILRALRYEQRLGFHLEPNTEQLMRRDAAVMDEVSGERLWHELQLILNEQCPEKVLSRADELGVLQKLHPALKGNGWLRNRFEQARRASAAAKPSPALYLALLAYRLSEEENEDLLARLRIRGEIAKVVRQTIKLKQLTSALTKPRLAPSAIYHLVQKYPPESISAAALASDSRLVRQRLKLYLTELRHIKPALSGDDLQAMGISPGRKLGQVLRALHDAKLDGKVQTREQEEDLVRELLG